MGQFSHLILDQKLLATVRGKLVFVPMSHGGTLQYLNEAKFVHIQLYKTIKLCMVTLNFNAHMR